MRFNPRGPAVEAMKKIENRLENLFPGKFRSRYAMVCYGGEALSHLSHDESCPNMSDDQKQCTAKEGNVSYANAKELGLVQAQILERLCLGRKLSLKMARQGNNLCGCGQYR